MKFLYSMLAVAALCASASASAPAPRIVAPANRQAAVKGPKVMTFAERQAALEGHQPKYGPKYSKDANHINGISIHAHAANTYVRQTRSGAKVISVAKIAGAPQSKPIRIKASELAQSKSIAPTRTSSGTVKTFQVAKGAN